MIYGHKLGPLMPFSVAYNIATEVLCVSFDLCHGTERAARFLGFFGIVMGLVCCIGCLLL